MSVKVMLEQKEEVEKFALILCVGIATCLRENVLSLDEARVMLFTPYSASRLKEGQARKAIQDLIFLACELEDVASFQDTLSSATAANTAWRPMRAACSI